MFKSKNIKFYSDNEIAEFEELQLLNTVNGQTVKKKVNIRLLRQEAG